MPEHWQRGEYALTTDPDSIDFATLHAFLRESYWAKGIPADVLRRAVERSLNFSLLHGDAFVGFVRVITDYATFAYVCDVYVLPEHRGQGLATWMMSCVLAHPELQGLRRWCLVTRDAGPVYAGVGFTPSPNPERWMEKTDPDVYTRVMRQPE